MLAQLEFSRVITQGLEVAQLWKLEGPFSVTAMVRGHRVYHSIWNAEVAEELPCLRETANPAAVFAVDIKKKYIIVGHVPKNISSICSVFLH